MANSIVPFGREMRVAHFSYATSYTPLNHGSYGASPVVVREYQHTLQREAEARPDPFIRKTLPRLLNESRQPLHLFWVFLSMKLSSSPMRPLESTLC